ncbi:MAG: DUF349 domain-containing protein [Bacteroidota bacterium]|nr:DUF349 domain-containing protein [Bacteroidota bacterium]
MYKHPYGSIREGKIYLNAFLDFPERKIGEVKESEESTVKYFEDRFLAMENKVMEIEQAIAQSDNKGSYLMKLIHLKQSLASHEGIGNYQPLFAKISDLEAELIALISNNRNKNLEIKKALLEEARQVKDTHDFKSGTEKFKEISEKWIKTGSVDKEQEENIEKEYKAIKDDFFSRRKSYFDDKKILQQARIEQYQAIIHVIKETDAKGNLAETVKKIKSLQEKWKEIGEIPAKNNKELWSQLKSLTNPIFERYNSSRNAAAGIKKNQLNLPEHKNQLLQQVESIVENPGPNDLEKLKSLQNEWKKSSFKSKEKNDPLREAFYFACDKARETSFLNKIALAKNRGFGQKPKKDQIKIKMHILKDLLNRDEKDLALYKENSEKFSSGQGSFTELVNNKLIIQERKVTVKKTILENLQLQLVENVPQEK